MAYPSAKENPDNRLCFWRFVWVPVRRPPGILGSDVVAEKHRAECKAGKSHARIRQERTSRSAAAAIGLFHGKSADSYKIIMIEKNEHKVLARFLWITPFA